MQEICSSDLLTLASIDHSDPECKQAFEEFHRRYKDFVWMISYSKAYSIDKNNAVKVAMVLSQNTFIKVHEKANVFEPKTPDVNKDCMAWISGILRNIALQYLDENNKHKKHMVFMEVIPEVDDGSSNEDSLFPVDSYNRRLLDNALKTLSEKERSILLAWYNFYTEGKVRSISTDIKEALAKQFNVKVDSLKQIKKRALNKVKTYIEQNKSL